MSREFPLAPLPRRAWLTLLGLGALTAAVALLIPPHRPAPAPPALLVPALVALGLAAPMLALRRRRITLHDGVLTIAAALFTRRIPVAALDLDQARIVDLAEHVESRPRSKTARGFSLPGFQAGLFRIRDGGKAFCLLTDQSRVLRLPQRDAPVLLLSPQHPQALLDALRGQAPRGA